jgi:DHA2 family multidrug resistance protein
VVLGGIAIATLIGFVVHELETEEPVVDLRVFSNRTYAASSGINLLMGLALFSGNFLFALFCGSVLRYSALEIGKVFLVSGGLQIVLMPLVGRFGGRFDQRLLLALGIAGVSVSLWLNAHLTTQSGFGDLVTSMFVRSVSLAFVFIPISMLALSDIPPSSRGNATGIFNLTRELGGSIGTAWMGLLVDRGVHTNAVHLSESVHPYSPIVQEQYGALLALPTYTSDGVAETMLALRVKTQALVLSFQSGFLQATGAFLACLLLIVLLKNPKPGAAAPGVH